MTVKDGDTKVQALLQIVQKKKDSIKSAENPVWQTNSMFSYFPETSNRTNLKVLKVPDLITVGSFLTSINDSYEKFAKSVNVKVKFNWMGFTYDQWINDIKNCIAKLELDKTRKELAELEERLNKLISPELRMQMELKAIEDSLSGDDNV